MGTKKPLMNELESGAIYLVQLCSGEQRRWKCLGHDSLTRSVWHDMETGREFNEASLMYGWEIVRRER
jgi:hypothetical protein